MRDLTQGPIPGHLVAMAAPIAAGMLAQTLYFLIDLYFVAQLGDAALAGVGAAGTAMFVVMALTQTLGVGTMALVSQAVGRKDPVDADLVFNQAMSLAIFCTAATLVGGYLLSGCYMRIVGADEMTIAAGITYLAWFMPGLALQYVNMVMISGLRGTGVVQPTMVVQIATVLLNALLAPILIGGWLTGKPLGVAGAGLASTLAVAAGTLMLALYFRKLEKYIHIRTATWRPRLPVWGRMINIGLPAGGEFGFMFLYMAVIYWVIRDFGAAAQAGFGLGIRLMQSIFLPAMAIAFATGPIAGQNYGAKQYGRVRETFRQRGEDQVRPHARADAVHAMAAGMAGGRIHGRPGRHRGRLALPADRLVQLRGVRDSSSPAPASSRASATPGRRWPRPRRASSPSCCRRSGSRRCRDYQIDQVWYVSVASVWVQAAISFVLLRRTMRARLA